MSISVWLLPTHPDEPAWSAINRVHGPGADAGLDADDPAARRTLHPEPPAGWRATFEDGLRDLGEWQESVDGTSTGMWTQQWRWAVWFDSHAAELVYRRTGPANNGDLDDSEVIDIARRLGMVIWWEPDAWIDLRADAPPEILG